jgi:hypothetical protein
MQFFTQNSIYRLEKLDTGKLKLTKVKALKNKPSIMQVDRSWECDYIQITSDGYLFLYDSPDTFVLRTSKLKI